MAGLFYHAYAGKLFSRISHVREFERDMKKLSKRFGTLHEDLGTFLKVALYAFHRLNIDSGGIVRISDLGFESPSIYKAKKFACRTLKGKGARSGIRIVYVYFDKEDRIEFIEVYYKGDKENEDREKIMKYYGA
jgi:hypothetical protein